MSKQRSEIQKAAGQLILAVQKEWNLEAGEPYSAESEAVMHTSHHFLQAGTRDALVSLLGERSIAQYLGEAWVERHPRVVPAIRRLEALLCEKNAA